jgi:two-component system LytT family response regulator
VELVGECANGSQAIEAIVELNPDLVFLDVRMPGVSGFDVIENIGTHAMPAVVFVSAHERYALRAFDVQAVDYVLKPVDPDRLRDAYDRAVGRITRDRPGDLSRRLQSVLDLLDRPSQPPSDSSHSLDRFVVKADGRLFFVRVDDVDYIEAAGNYATLHVGARTHVIRRTLDAIEQQFRQRFCRIRRSTLVNIGAIAALEPYGKGSYTVLLRGGERLLSSRFYGRQLKALLRT